MKDVERSELFDLRSGLMGSLCHGFEGCEASPCLKYVAAQAKQPLAGGERNAHHGSPLSLTGRVLAESAYATLKSRRTREISRQRPESHTSRPRADVASG